MLVSKYNNKNYQKYIIPRYFRDYTDRIEVIMDLQNNSFSLKQKYGEIDVNLEEWEERQAGSTFSLLRIFFMSEYMREEYYKSIL